MRMDEGPAGPETILNSRRRSTSSNGCSACGKAVRGVGSPGGEGADASGSLIAAESAPCEVFVGEGAC